MKKIITVAIALPLLFIPTANAETPVEVVAKAKTQAQLAAKDAQIAKVKAHLALEKAKAAKEKAKTAIKDVDLLNKETIAQLNLIKKQVAALNKLLKK